MIAAFELELADHIDRVRRLTAPCRAGVVMGELPGGWLSARPGSPVGDFPSASLYRVYWLTLRGALTREQIDAAVAGFRRIDCGRFFAWLAPWAWNDSVEASLQAAGARHVHWIRYLALARESGQIEAARPTEFTTRRIGSDEAETFFSQVASWYGQDSSSLAARMVAQGTEEAFGAFCGERPIGVGLLTMDRAGSGWGYLGAAATDPEFRGRGAQIALIAARVRRVAEVGAGWCSVETNTAVPISLRNLERSGFIPKISWRVYEWNLAPA